MKSEASTLRRPVPTSHQLARRQAQLQDLQRYLSAQEEEFAALRELVLQFARRYDEQLGALYQELDELDAQLHAAMQKLDEHAGPADLTRSAKSANPSTPLTPPALPAAPPPPQAPEGMNAEIAPPSLKQLYRRAAMRFHPDRANHGQASRYSHELAMMAVNQAYAEGNRAGLERLLLEAGELPARVTGNDQQARLAWLQASEKFVQDRLALVQRELRSLRQLPMHRLWLAITRAEQLGLDPLGLMAKRLRTQIAERRQEIYIGQRLAPMSALAATFVRQCLQRQGGDQSQGCSV